ncbi:unnamed protein product [Discula destructiva]
MGAVDFQRLLDLTLPLVIYAISAGIVYYIGQIIYNVFFHPLASYPGPFLWRASRLPFCINNLRGTLPFDVLPMFERYGPVVRIAPNELAYAYADAWKEIVGHNPKGEENSKFTPFYRPDANMPQDLISADRELHGKLRRQLAHGFSDRSMREQEPLIKGYIDMLMSGLRNHCENGKEALDMCMWYNFTTFDVIGDLAFGEPFGCLEKSARHPWIENMFHVSELGTFMQCATHYPSIKNLILRNIPESYLKIHKYNTEFATSRVQKRMELGAERHDLIEGLLRKQDELQLPLRDISSHANLLIVAGSETTATLMSGVTYLLLQNPEALARLTEEVRSTFASEDEITIETAGHLKYMLACLNEALRMYAPVPIGLPRQVPKGGKTYLDKYVPEGTIVGIWQWATSHYSDNWVEPFSYRPERFLEGENDKFAADKKDSMQPFSYGPRNCIGKNLAYAEMRTIIARIVFNFDLKLAPQSEGWMEKQKVYNLWAKPPLMVHLTPRVMKE